MVTKTQRQPFDVSTTCIWEPGHGRLSFVFATVPNPLYDPMKEVSLLLQMEGGSEWLGTLPSFTGL